MKKVLEKESLCYFLSKFVDEGHYINCMPKKLSEIKDVL